MMNNQVKKHITLFRVKTTQLLWMFLGLVMLLWAGANLNTASAADYSLDDILRTGDFKTQKLGYEKLGGHNSLVIQVEPRNKAITKSLGYSQIRAWYDTVDQLTRKIVLFDAEGNTLSTVLFTGMSSLKGKRRATHMEVTNHRTGQTCNFDINSKSNLSHFM